MPVINTTMTGLSVKPLKPDENSTEHRESSRTSGSLYLHIFLGLGGERFTSDSQEKSHYDFLGFTSTILSNLKSCEVRFYREKADTSIGKRPISYTHLTPCQSETCPSERDLANV